MPNNSSNTSKNNDTGNMILIDNDFHTPEDVLEMMEYMSDKDSRAFYESLSLEEQGMLLDASIKQSKQMIDLLDEERRIFQGFEEDQLLVLAENGSELAMLVSAEKCEEKAKNYIEEADKFEYRNDTKQKEAYIRKADQEYINAAQWYEMAGKTGNVNAQYRAGYLYEKLNRISKARDAYEKAAAMGHKDAAKKAASFKDSDIYIETIAITLWAGFVSFVIIIIICSFVKVFFQNINSLKISGITSGIFMVLCFLTGASDAKSYKTAYAVMFCIVAVVIALCIKIF